MRGLVKEPQDYPWSSASAHAMGQNDRLVKSSAMLNRVSNWRQFLADGTAETHIAKLRSHQRTGRLLGSEEFTVKLEELSGRVLRRKKPGPKREVKDN